ncbi:hypothetical protein N5923_23565 [Erwiniaceae bacterium BAC15a-03b]|uniref:Uncharacterized protein n=1 Tax=Winslowiella arboricola TaxID=2978220 RepID=A0A9J6PVD1_9GAMM|nr:hypothetical protein [Winslowiella arboricola]MCU5775071.1 hypothetical protein [Winslowiella arboricola]MCU5780475.1 hypothetical protein [Winslowiella arboricola]
MRKIAMYRRGRGCPNDGLREKVAWQLSKVPMTGKELAAIFRMEPRELHKALGSHFDRTKVATITATEWTTDSEGNRDRTYTLTASPKRIAPKVTPKKTIVVSWKAFAESGEEQRQENILAAQRRARLIKAGLWITEL